MKVAITGHSTGIGAALATFYKEKGYEVVGFSLSNGYDIRIPEQRKQLITESADCDIFFNNAHPDYSFAQCDLLFELWEAWANTEKKIVNISSSLTMRWQCDNGKNWDIKYRSAKVALEESCEFLWNKGSWPSVVCISPCLTDTPRVGYDLNTNKINPIDFAEIVYYNLSTTNFRVQKLALAVNPIEEYK